MSTCDHICRECGQVMNCQHCKPYSLPADRARIAALDVGLSSLKADLDRVGLMTVRDGEKLLVAIKPGHAETLRAAFKL